MPVHLRVDLRLTVRVLPLTVEAAPCMPMT